MSVASYLVSVQMSRFVARHFGAQGRTWLARLPGLVERCAAEWDLLIEDGLEGGLLSCVMSARSTDGQPVVLKIGGPWTPIDREAWALEHWAGGPAPSLLAADQRLGAVLLERISPGSIATEHPAEQVAGLLRALHAVRPSAPEIALLPSLAELVEERITTAGEEAFARSPAEATIPCIGDASYDAAYWAIEGSADGVEDRINTLSTSASLDHERTRRWSAVIALNC